MRKVYCIHGDTKDIKSLGAFFRIGNLLNDFDVVWDKSSPDILFSTEHIFYNKTYWNLFKKLSKIAKINVFYSLEALTVDLNMFDIVKNP